MSNYSADKDNEELELHRERSILRNKGQDILNNVDKALKKGKSSIDPRQQFNNWLRSQEGKRWKREEFQSRKGICAYCGEPMREADTVVHHVEAIQKLGNSANEVENYRLLHPSCNNAIGTKTVNLLF
jgi:5-methylcytosine-specific restriction endonuclease McrA